MTEQQMYIALNRRIEDSIYPSMIPNQVGDSILHDFVQNIKYGIYPKYAYDRANGKINYLLEHWLAEVF